MYKHGKSILFFWRFSNRSSVAGSQLQVLHPKREREKILTHPKKKENTHLFFSLCVCLKMRCIYSYISKMIGYEHIY
jgi:hypothetical protein